MAGVIFNVSNDRWDIVKCTKKLALDAVISILLHTFGMILKV